ncbi:MAG TPA: PHB depolymerase family esterase, partial [Bacteroidia bacterium]|nr:PHB depolymerase family esterase [Bacteroidia bacterium]
FFMKKISIAFLLACSFFATAQTGWQPVTSFGSNPGNLNMYSYVPTGIIGSAPLVVVMHGCTQNAITVATQTGWNTLADRHKFNLVYPEQKSANNSSTCFNWFLQGDENRNQGEAYSIKQMVDYMKAHYNIDTNQIFVTGLSAGACMTNVMMACYPDIFKAGVVMAGAPYKAGAAALYGYTTTISPTAWGDSVRTGYPGYTGAYPKVAVFQGSADPVVNPQNETEIMKQWTNIHGATQTPASTITSFNGNPYVTKNIYNDPSGNEVVETYTITGMGHAVPLDTGSCYRQCGQTGTYALEVYLSSAFWSAYFFNILNNNSININGATSVISNQTNVTYSVTATASTTYTWSVPAGATITVGQGTNQITVSFGSVSGNVSVTETSSACKVGPLNVFVSVGTTGVSAFNEQQTAFQIFPNPASGNFNLLLNVAQKQNITIQVVDMLGRVVEASPTQVYPAGQTQITLGNQTNYLPGVYFVNLTINGQHISKKVIVQ